MLFELSADEKVRVEYEMRLKAQRDQLWEIDQHPIDLDGHSI